MPAPGVRKVQPRASKPCHAIHIAATSKNDDSLCVVPPMPRRQAGTQHCQIPSPQPVSSWFPVDLHREIPTSPKLVAQVIGTKLSVYVGQVKVFLHFETVGITPFRRNGRSE